MPEVERQVVRLVVLDARRHVLLLHVRILTDPALGTVWELPGGGLEPGESYAEAAVRELREETGIVIAREDVPTPTWRRDASYTYHGEHRFAHELIVAVKLPYAAPAVESTHRVAYEQDDLCGSRWWPVDEITHSTERFYPRSLPAVLADFLAGREIEEPPERWD